MSDNKPMQLKLHRTPPPTLTPLVTPKFASIKVTHKEISAGKIFGLVCLTIVITLGFIGALIWVLCRFN